MDPVQHNFSVQETNTVVGDNPSHPFELGLPFYYQALLMIQRWHWPIETITANLKAISSADIEALHYAAQTHP